MINIYIFQLRIFYLNDKIIIISFFKKIYNKQARIISECNEFFFSDICIVYFISSKNIYIIDI